MEIEIINNGPEYLNSRRALVIVPGGGYDHVSEREADPVAINFLNQNYAIFILRYTVNVPYPTQITELMCVMDYIHRHYKQLNIDKDKVTLCGFSAGGHIVATYSYLYKNQELISRLDNKVNIKNLTPNALILAYPVITMHDFSHPGSKKIVTQNNDELINLLSVENHIDNDFPPTFVFHTTSDTSVNVINTRLLVKELKKNHIKFKVKYYSNLNHGISISTKLVNNIPQEKLSAYKKAHNWLCESYKFLDELYD